MEEKEIILAKICSILDKPYFIIEKNGEMKKYLKCCGLGALYDENSEYFEPYWYNGTWNNRRNEYSIFIGLDNVFADLLEKNDTKKLSLFITELGKNINPVITEKYYEDEQYARYVDELISLYQLLGYDLVKKDNYFDVIPLTGSVEKIADVYGLEQWLLEKYPEIYNSYEGAIDSYVSGNFGTCIEACRTTLTGLFSKYKGPDSFAKWFRGTADISGEYDGANMLDIKDHLEGLGKKELSDFFEENAAGSYKKTRAIYSIYSMLSDYGMHRQEGTVEIPSKEDALMMLRMTEDIMIWVFQKKDNEEWHLSRGAFFLPVFKEVPMKLPTIFGIRGARDKPKDSYGGSAYSFFFGRSTSGKNVNERTAMQTTAVYSCVRILAEAVASLPIHVYRYTDTGKERVYDHPLYYLLHDEPNPEMTSFVFRETLMSHLLIWGNAYAQVIRDGSGRVLSLYPLLPDKMEVDRDEHGRLFYTYTRNTDENPNFSECGRVRLKPEDVLHIPGLGFDGLVGYSPIAMAKNAVGMTLACEEYGASFFENGATPGGVLEHPGVLKDPAKVRESWHSVYGGSKNAGKVAVLEEGMKYQQIGIPPEEAQFLETRKFQIDEIARLYRIPPHMVGDLDKSSFSNIEQQSLEFVKYTLDPWVIRWEQSIQKALFLPQEKKEYFVKMNVDGLLRGDYESRMKGYSIGIQNGFMCPNDIRRLESMDLIPVEEGGEFFSPTGTYAD